MKARSEVHGAVSIVNAIASGKGSALGISLKVIAEVEMKKGIETKIISQNTNDYSLVVSIITKSLVDKGEGIWFFAASLISSI